MITVTCEEGSIQCHVAGKLPELLADVHYITASMIKAILDMGQTDGDRFMLMAAVSAALSDAVPTAMGLMNNEDEDEEGRATSSGTSIRVDMSVFNELLNKIHGDDSEGDTDETDTDDDAD